MTLSVRELTVTYGSLVAVDRASFDLEPGALTGLVGPNGAGKSSALQGLLGLIPRRSGKVLKNGTPLRRGDRELVYAPQRRGIDQDFPITVREVVAQGRYGHAGLLRRFNDADRAAIDDAMVEAEIVELGDRQIGELSGGQQQRAFLARALAQRGSVYLLDEPFAGVDAATEQTLIRVLRQLRDAGAAILVVHHDLATVPRYFDRLILINRKVTAAGPTSEVFTRERLGEAYGGHMAVIDGDLYIPQARA